MPYVSLFIAIIAEVIATSALKASQCFTQVLPSIIVVIGYGISFYFLSLTLETMPVSIAYALWSGIGTLLITCVSYFYFNQSLDIPAIIGIICIGVGVIIINLFSSMKFI